MIVSKELFVWREYMAEQKISSIQTAQDTELVQDDVTSRGEGLGSGPDVPISAGMETADMGGDRSPRKTETRRNRRKSEPAIAAYEGSVSTRTPKNPGQGISNHSAAEESARQEKVVKDRPDAQAGVNHSK